MKSYFIIILLFISSGIQAQEVLSKIYYPSALNSNPIQSLSQESSAKTINRSSIHYQYFYDTLSLPFVDDFSANHLKKFNFPQQSDIFDTVYSNSYFYYSGGKCITGGTAFQFSTDTSWFYNVDIANQKIDSFPNNSTVIIFYDSISDCQNQTNVLQVWPVYYRHFFDLNGKEDSVFVTSLLDTFDLIQNAGFRDTTYSVKDDSTAWWIDNFAFLNNTYPKHQLTIGVATLDGLDENGNPYNKISQSYGQADSLTSKPIDLSPYNVGDSIYFSFFYEAQGYGDYPNKKDSLVVEFKNKNDKWNIVWAIQGPDSEAVDNFFAPVVIPLLDATAYFYKGFQFRFRNKATISGNNDHWHIDYVRLKSAPNFNVFQIGDYGFTRPATSLLKNYAAMPWKQFKANPTGEIAQQHLIFARNNDIVPQFGFYYSDSIFEVLSNTFIDAYTESFAINMPPQTDTTFIVYDTSTIPIPTNIQADSAIIRFKYVLNGDNFEDITSNDTLLQDQKFFNYYAYDDGSAEKAYGIFGADMKLAYEFHLNQPDTLQGIQFHFVHYNADVSNKEFALMVWKSISPEVVLFTDSFNFRKPGYKDSLNGFTSYKIDPPLVLDSGMFFIGWQQIEDDLLNVGYDLNYELNLQTTAQHAYYTDLQNGGAWVKSKFTGALMIRPLIGKTLNITWDNLNEFAPKISNENGLWIYPNPVENNFSLLVPSESKRYDLLIYNYMGSLIAQQEWKNEPLDVRSFPAGLYLVKIIEKETHKTFSAKFIKF